MRIDSSDEINKILEHFSVFVDKPSEFVPFTNLNIVLDLDETLVHTFENDDFKQTLNHEQINFIRSRIFEYKIVDPNMNIEDSTYNIYGIMRPWLKLFLIFCFVYFKNVIVWSAGQPRYVMKIVDILFRDIFPPLIIYTQEDTEITDEFTHKPLKKLFRDSRLCNCGINEKNTIVIDDRSDTFSLNEMNGICIPEFKPEKSFEELITNDPSLLQLIYWLMQEDVMKTKDIRNLVKQNIFKEPYHFESLKRCRMVNGKLHCLSREVMNIVKKIH